MEIFVYRNGAEKIDESFSRENLPELLADKENLVWVDLEQPTAADNKILSDIFHFHPLTIEDAIETRNHPKVESFNDYLFFIVHGVTMETNSTNFVTRELNVYLGENFIVTYHYEFFRSINAVKSQIRANTFVCRRGADYLLHQILDRLVDLYLLVVDEVIGQLLVFLFIPFAVHWYYVVAGFLLFRLFDIWKPYPIDSLQNLPAGIGVCADDILAGVYAGTVLSILYAISISFYSF
jgi:phosphatidylglycerophosphatase A